MPLTRAIKFEVIFPGLRKKDLPKLYRRLWGVQGDLTRGAQRVISALWQLQLGHLEHPTKEGKDGKLMPIPPRTLAWHAMSGKWQPYGYPLYEPYEGKKRTHPRASSGVLSAIGEVIHVRLKTDAKDLRSGRKTLSNFAGLPIYYRRSEIRLQEDGSLALTTFAGRKNNRVIVRPRKLDASQREILRRCQSGEYKHGSATLSWKKREGRTGKWILSMAWTDTNHEVADPGAAPLVAGIDLGIDHAMWIAYTDANGNARGRNDVIEFPRSIIRSVTARRKERSTRSKYNRKTYGLREGRGRKRKARSVDALGKTISRTHDTMIKQMAAAAIKHAQRRGATLIVLEDHKDWSVSTMHDDADHKSKRQAARVRKTYFRWHQGAMRIALEHAAEKAGIKCLVIDPAYSSRICSSCGKLWKHTGIYAPKGAKPTGTVYGRYELRRFRCDCGAKVHADRNAAINLARKGLIFERQITADLVPLYKAADSDHTFDLKRVSTTMQPHVPLLERAGWWSKKDKTVQWAEVGLLEIKKHLRKADVARS